MLSHEEHELWVMTDRIAKNTNCVDKAVGCVIYHIPSGKVVGRGWNTHKDVCDCDSTKTAVHAEDNALKSLTKMYEREDLILFVNHAPCKNCKSLIETRVKEVRYRSQK